MDLDSRYHTFAVRFMRTCFAHLLSATLRNFTQAATLPSLFEGIYLTDATSFQLPASFAEFYPSNGGDTSGAAVKIHQTYDLVKGQVVDLHLTAGKANDYVRILDLSQMTLTDIELVVGGLDYNQYTTTHHYLGEDDQFKNLLTQEITQYPNLALQAPTGKGKTTLLINFLKEI